MAIKFDHAVKYNGKYYPANTLIEEKPAQKAVEASESADAAQADKESVAEEKPAQKATKARKKASGGKA